MKTFKTSDCEIFLHDNDLPSDIDCEEIISVDTETTGLSLVRDQLCLIQIGISSKKCHIVKFERNFFEKKNLPLNLALLSLKSRAMQL